MCTDLIPIQQNVSDNIISMFFLNLTRTFPSLFFATEGKSGLVNDLFHSCSTHRNVGGPIRLCCISDVVYGNNGTQESWVMEAVCRRLKLHRTETRSQEGCQEFHEWLGYVRELDSWRSQVY